MTGSTSDVTLWQGDCLELMGRIPDGTVDLIAADLPYGTTACAWDSVIPVGPLWAHYRRILSPCGAVVLTASQPFTATLVMSNPGWFRCEWVWLKSNGGGFLNANRMPLKRHESVLVFGPGATKYTPQKVGGKPYRCRSSAAGETTQDQTVAGWVTDNNGDRYPTTALYFPNDTGLHPTQKPVELFEYLIRTYSDPGDLVLDNTMGSGTTGVAARRTGRRFIGIEQDPIHFATAERRIADALRPVSRLDPRPVRPMPGQLDLFTEARP